MLHDAPADTKFWRVLRALPPASPLEYAKTCYPADGNNRFTPITVHGKIVPAAYAGSTPEIALWEVVLRDIRHKGIKRVPKHETSNRYLVETRLARPLKLLDLRRPMNANLVAGRKHSPNLSAAPKSAYGVTREWAEQLYTRIPEIDGLIYESHQVPGECIVLYQPRDPEVFKPVAGAQRVSDEPIRSILSTEAKKAGRIIDFGDLPDPPI